MLPQIVPSWGAVVGSTLSAVLAYHIGYWWGRRALRRRLAGLYADLQDLQANGIHSATYWKYQQPYL